VATLVLFRHGQAGFLEAEYDILSDLGARQTAALGAYWGARGRAIDRAFVGPLVRQRRSLESFRAAFVAAGGAAFDAASDTGLEEYHALEMMRLAVPALEATDPVVQQAVAGIARNREGEVGQHKERLFQHVSRRWVRREFEVPGVTPFHTFRSTVEDALARATADVPHGATVALFTSGGVVAAAVGDALGLDDERTLELSWVVKNAAFTELAFDPRAPRRRQLLSFNAVPHLDHDAELLTLR